MEVEFRLLCLPFTCLTTSSEISRWELSEAGDNLYDAPLIRLPLLDRDISKDFDCSLTSLRNARSQPFNVGKLFANDSAIFLHMIL